MITLLETQFLVFDVFEETVVEFNLAARGMPTSRQSLPQTLDWRSLPWIGTRSRGAYLLLNILQSRSIYLSPGTRTQWFLLLLRPEHIGERGHRGFPLFRGPGRVLDSSRDHPYT